MRFTSKPVATMTASNRCSPWFVVTTTPGWMSFQASPKRTEKPAWRSQRRTLS